MSVQDEYAFWYVERGDTLWGIARQVFKDNSSQAIQKHVAELVQRNPWLKNPNRIQPGQVIAIGPPTGTASASPTGADIEAMQQSLQMPQEDRLKMLENFPLLIGLDGAGFGREHAPPKEEQTVALRLLNGTLSGYNTYKDPLRGVKAAVKLGPMMATGDFGNLLRRSPFAWQQIEGQVVRNLQKNIQYVARPDGALQLIPKDGRAYAQTGKILIVRPKSAEFLKYAAPVQRAKWIGKNLLKPAGTVFKVLDFGAYGYNMVNAVGKPDQGRTMFVESAKYAAGLGWSAYGLGAAGAVCGFLTVTTGPGGVACYFVVLAGGSYLASKGSGYLSDKLYSGGEVLYEHTTQLWSKP